MKKITTSTVESLLGVLSLGPMSGYDMRKFMENSTGNFWTESFGQIYPALKGMLAEGLVEVEKQSPDAHRAKKVYRITAIGQTRLREWLALPAQRRGARNELLLKLFYGSQAEPRTLAANMAAWRATYEADLERYRAMFARLQVDQKAHPGLPFWNMTLRYGIAEAEALLAWCDGTQAELKSLAVRRDRGGPTTCGHSGSVKLKGSAGD